MQGAVTAAILPFVPLRVAAVMTTRASTTTWNANLEVHRTLNLRPMTTAVAIALDFALLRVELATIPRARTTTWSAFPQEPLSRLEPMLGTGSNWRVKPALSLTSLSSSTMSLRARSAEIIAGTGPIPGAENFSFQLHRLPVALVACAGCWAIA